ncbi:MAG: SRPBCC family protein [Jatrophihabitantaceae bacterium]
MKSTDTRASAVVLAPVLTVYRCLGDIATIAASLPGVCSVRLDRAGHGIDLGYRLAGDRTATLAEHYRLHNEHHQVDWQLTGLVNYRGSFTVFGDASLSQLTSTVSTDQPEWLGRACEQHQQMLRRLVCTIETAAHGRDRDAASPASDGTFLPVPLAPDRPG